TDIRHLRTAVLDADRTVQSRDLIAAYRASNYFDIVATVGSEEELAYLMDRGAVRAGLLIPAGFGADVAAGRQATIAVVIDGSDPNVANTVFAASQQVGLAHSLRFLERRIGASAATMTLLEVRPRVWYNPQMRSANFVIPGLVAMILFLLTSMFTALSIVRERERGTIEQLMVTPIRPIEMVVGKIMPYVGVAFFDILEVLAIAVFWFRVPIHGSLLLLLALLALSMITSLGIGIFVSSVASTQQEAMLLVWLMILPSIFLSGFFFPIEAMPKALQAVSYVVPLRYMLVIIRGIILKGVGLRILAEQVVALAVFGVGIMVVAAARFRKRLG
ncbi:MAG: ABC transporter permease, partial [Thermoflexia bacterium]